MTSERRQSWVVFLAEGFGSGRLRPGPGTWGSVVGLAWFALLLVPGNAVVFGLGALGAAAFAVWACGAAEYLLNRHDPPSVVLDEIVAIPLCFLPQLVAQAHAAGGRFPDLPAFLHAWPWWLVPAGFVAFRVFDIFKPWPIRQIQRLPGGWGVVADDLLASVWVMILGLLVAG